MRWACLLIVSALIAAACGADPVADAGDDPVAAPTQRITYGADALQFGDLTIPAGAGPHPVVVFIHGGFWLNQFDLTLSEPQAADAVANGYAAWNVEYRRVGDDGGGYPGTLDDIAAAVDRLAGLADEYDLDLDRVSVVGHSAGGHLALWVGQRSLIPSGAPGADPVVVPALVVGQAPVADLASNLDLGGGAVERFMGASPADEPDRYAVADPARLLPIDVPQLIVQGADDRIVPADRAATYAALIDDPEGLEILEFDGAGHFDMIDPAHDSWAAVLERLP
jgi:acetyl esterase/lipase